MCQYQESLGYKPEINNYSTHENGADRSTPSWTDAPVFPPKFTQKPEKRKSKDRYL